MRTPGQDLLVAPITAGDARSSRRHGPISFASSFVLFVLAVAAAEAISLTTTLATPLTARLTEQQARRRAETLIARVAGPRASSVVAVGAWAMVNDPGLGRTPLAEWQVECRTGEGPYFVRLEADTGQVLAIAPQTLRDAVDDRGGRRSSASRGTIPPALLPRPPLSAARAEVLARRYLKMADLAPPPPLHPPLLVSASPLSRSHVGPGTRPDVRWFAGPLNPACSVTFRRGLRRGDAGDGGERKDGSETLSVRVDMDARDGSLHGLYRFRRVE